MIRILFTLSVYFPKVVLSESGEPGCPRTSEPCLEYDRDNTLSRETWFYFDSDLGDCVALRSDCAVPVREVVFSSQSECRDSCGG